MYSAHTEFTSEVSSVRSYVICTHGSFKSYMLARLTWLVCYKKSPCLEKSRLSKKSQLSWNVMLCNWVSSSSHFKGLQCLHLHVQVLQEDPMTQCNIPEDLNSLQQ